MTLGHDLKAYRNTHNLSLMDVAIQLDISVNALGEIEAGNLSGPRAHEYALAIGRLIAPPQSDAAALARMLRDEQAAHEATKATHTTQIELAATSLDEVRRCLAAERAAVEADIAVIEQQRNDWQSLATQRQHETEVARRWARRWRQLSRWERRSAIEHVAAACYEQARAEAALERLAAYHLTQQRIIDHEMARGECRYCQAEEELRGTAEEPQYYIDHEAWCPSAILMALNEDTRQTKDLAQRCEILAESSRFEGQRYKAALQRLAQVREIVDSCECWLPPMYWTALRALLREPNE